MKISKTQIRKTEPRYHRMHEQKTLSSAISRIFVLFPYIYWRFNYHFAWNEFQKSAQAERQLILIVEELVSHRLQSIENRFETNGHRPFYQLRSMDKRFKWISSECPSSFFQDDHHNWWEIELNRFLITNERWKREQYHFDQKYPQNILSVFPMDTLKNSTHLFHSRNDK